MQHSLIKTEGGEQVLTLFVPGDDNSPYIAHDSHPNFKAIITALICEDDVHVDDVVDLFDIANTVAQRFEELSERITVGNGRIYLDGDEVHNALTKQILRFMEEGEDFEPLVNFFENVQSNPSQHSKEQLYEWLDRHDFTITPDGLIVAYKGVRADGSSIHAGPAIVDGQPVNGHVPNEVGSVITMARGDVHADSGVGCSRGLHVGTREYASTWTTVGKVLEVLVNPRDVVSVPTDCNAQKVRCCRYEVVDISEAKITSAVKGYAPPSDFDPDDDEEECYDCGELLEDCDCEIL